MFAALTSLWMTLAIILSVHVVMQGCIKQHKAWIVRAYALVLGAGTQVLIMLPMTLVAGASPFFFYVLMAWA
ncbi:MAG: hypothetical protein Q7R66_11005 [Undibacterium sp.]|nr:hypothetical protein [Undibacterium sp.]MDO8652708.1 hypothetical protein [Undibacterium sp.]